MKKQIKLSKEKLKKLAEVLKNRKLKKINKKVEKQILPEENKFIESGIVLEKISPVLKPVANAQEGLEQRASSFLLEKRQEKEKDNKKPYESEKQKYFSQSNKYKIQNENLQINEYKIQNENLQNPTGVEKGMVHMGIEQATKRKSERFFDEEQDKKYSADFTPLEEVKKNKDKMYIPTRDPAR